MKLNFEIVENIGLGSHPNIVHFWDNQIQLFYVRGGRLYSKVARVVDGELENLEFLGERRLLENEDSEIKNVTMLGMYGNIVIGSYQTETEQKMFVYEY